MTCTESNQKFVEAWGLMSSIWGVSRSESQVYALLLIRNELLPAEEIMKELHMSRGNVNMVLHTLMDFEMVYKAHKKGERKEFFRAETNLWTVMEKLVKYYKRRSVDHLLDMVADIHTDRSSGAHLERLKSDMKDIAKVFSTMVDYLPVLKNQNKWQQLPKNEEVAQVVSMYR